MIRATDRVARWQAALAAAGVKLTHQRLEILDVLAGRDDHPDAEALFAAVRARVATVSIDTVYRTLWLLHEHGLVDTLGPRREAMRFDPNRDRHHHFVCVRCGLVRDFESPELHELRLPECVAQMGGALEARVEVRGICTSCREREPELRREEP